MISTDRPTRQWVRVTKRRPCAVCSGTSWCTTSADGQVVICMRTQSDRPVDCKGAGVGWLHRLSDPRPVVPRKRTEERPPIPIDFPALTRQCVEMVKPEALSALAESLGVTVHSLTRLSVGWSPPARAWTFPMLDPQGKIVGLRLRNEQGRKWAVRGSHQGLFLPDGYMPDLCEQVVICEGPTDTAAALDLGAYAIGRPSCQGCEDWIVDLCRRREVVIVADCDEAKVGPDGKARHPGQEGALKLARMLHRKSKWTKLLLPLKGKDIRDWLRQGCTADVLRTMIRHTDEWKPEK